MIEPTQISAPGIYIDNVMVDAHLSGVVPAGLNETGADHSIRSGRAVESGHRVRWQVVACARGGAGAFAAVVRSVSGGSAVT